MKKRIALVLFICVLLSCAGSSAAAEGTTSCLMFDDFDSYETGYVMQSLIEKAVVEAEAANKYLSVDIGAKKKNLSVLCRYPDKFVAQYRLYTEANLADSSLFSVVNDSGSEYPLFSIERMGKAADGKPVPSITPNTWHEVKLIYDGVRKRYSLILDGKTLLNNYKLPEISGSVAEVRASFKANTAEATELKLDDIYIYPGLALSYRLPKSVYNPNTAKDEGDAGSTTEEEHPWTDHDFDYDNPEIYIRDGFEKHDTIATANFEVMEKGNKFEIVKDANGNKVYRLQRTAGADPYVEIYRQCEEDYGGGKWYPDDEWVVFEADFGFEKIDQSSLFALRSKSGVRTTLVSLGRNGDLTAADGTIFDRVKEGENHKLQCLVNFRTGVYTVYNDGVAVLKNAATLTEDFGRLASWRIHIATMGPVTLTLDNLAIYASDKVLDLNEYGGFEKVVFPQDETALQQAKGGAAFRDNSRYAVIGGERLRFEDAAVMDRENDRFYVPCSMAEACAGDEIPEEEQAQYAGRAYVELTQLADLKGWAHCFKRSGVDQDGLAIIAPTSLDGYRDGRESCRELNNYLQFERPKQARILEDFAATSKGQHPRIFVNKQQMDSMIKQLKVEESKIKLGAGILASAENALGAGEMKCTYDGIRLVENTILPRVYNLSLAYLMTGDSRYRDRLWQDLKTYGDSQAAWAPGHFLSATQPAIAYAVAYDWLYESWTEEQRGYIAEILVTRSLNYAYMAMHGNWTYQVFWCKAPENDADELGNWPVICRAGQLTAALALMDEYPEFCADIAESSFRHIEYPIMEFCPDGAWAEGTGYWAYTLNNLASLFAAADSALGTHYGYSDLVPLRKTINYGLGLMGPQGMFGFGDTGGGRDSEADVAMECFSYFANSFDDENYMIYRNRQSTIGQGITTPFDYAFLDPRLPKDKVISGDQDAFFSKITTGAMRDGFLDDSTYLAYHCGSNLAGHMNYDSGTFIFDAIGARWACELGRENYDCHDGYRTRAEGQNVYVINPGQDMGQDVNTPHQGMIRRENNGYESLAIMDLSESYASGADKAKRGVKLTDNRKTMVVRDEITLKAPSEFYWFMHMYDKVDVQIDGNTAILTQNGKQMKFEFIANQPLTIEVMKATQLPSSPARDSREYDNSEYQKLALHGTGLTGDLNITVKLSPNVTGIAFPAPDDTPLASWTLTEQAASDTAKPVLDTLQVNGREIRGFDREKTMLTYAVSDIESTLVDGTCGEQYELVKTRSANGDWALTVFEKSNPFNYRVYGLTFIEVPTPDSAYQPLTPVTIAASDEPQSANAAKNVFDLRLDTRWSADAAAPYIDYSFSGECTVNMIGLGTHEGTKRINEFDILVSDDGVNYRVVYSGVTSGTTNDIEYFDIGGVKCKYVRLRVNRVVQEGADIAWKSVTEFHAFGRD